MNIPFVKSVAPGLPGVVLGCYLLLVSVYIFLIVYTLGCTN